MATHAIEMTLPRAIKVKNTDVVFVVRENGKVIGTVRMSKGGLEYTPAHKQGKGTIRLSWLAFDRFIRGV
jgi:hypothetical protein